MISRAYRVYVHTYMYNVCTAENIAIALETLEQTRSQSDFLLDFILNIILSAQMFIHQSTCGLWVDLCRTRRRK